MIKTSQGEDPLPSVDGVKAEVGDRLIGYLCKACDEWHFAPKDCQVSHCPSCGAAYPEVSGGVHGIYEVTKVGNADEPWRLRRHDDGGEL